MVWLLATGAAVWFLVLLTSPFLPAPFSAAVYALGSFICHQRPERSFELAGMQLPVCARCLGVYGGAAAGAFLAPAIGRIARRRTLIGIAVMPAVVSLLLEWSGAATLTNTARAVTGLIAGGMIAAVVLATLHYERCAPPRPMAPNRPPTPT